MGNLSAWEREYSAWFPGSAWEREYFAPDDQPLFRWSRQGAPLAIHHVGQRELQLRLLLVDGAVELGDELGVVVGDFFFEGFAGCMAEGADEGTVQLA